MRADVHDTPAKDFRRGFGVDWKAHFLPFQCAATAPLRPSPTVVHTRAVAHDTPNRLPLVTGLRWVAHFLPFHR